MKHIVKKSALLALLGGLALPAAAQTTGAAWRPFRVGQTYYYETNQTPPQLETVRLAGAQTIGTDSVYRFASFYRPVTSADTFQTTCLPPWIPMFKPDTNTPLGAQMEVELSGDYVLRLTTGVAVRIRPGSLPVGASWVFCANPAITATVVTREVQPVGAAQVPDSVAVVALSNGGQLVLSKQFGLLNAPDLRTLTAAAPIALELLTIPERGLGALPRNTPIDWQPGDSVIWSESGPSICQSGWSVTRYLSRRVSANRDTIYHGGTIQYASITYGANCSGGRNVYVSPPMPFTRSTYVGNGGDQIGHLLGQVALPGQPTMSSGQGFVNQGAYYVPIGPLNCLGGWRFRYSAYLQLDTCRNALAGGIDFGQNIETLDGFGVISSRGVWGDEGNVVWYRSGNQTCGSIQGFPRSELLATPALLPAERVQLFPNPATTTARLNLTGTKGGALNLTATDALGRRVWQHTQTIGPDADLVLPTASWAPGVYYVRVALPEGARTIRVVKE
jgi:hypothetical protein